MIASHLLAPIVADVRVWREHARFTQVSLVIGPLLWMHAVSVGATGQCSYCASNCADRRAWPINVEPASIRRHPAPSMLQRAGPNHTVRTISDGHSSVGIPCDDSPSTHASYAQTVCSCTCIDQCADVKHARCRTHGVKCSRICLGPALGEAPGIIQRESAVADEAVAKRAHGDTVPLLQ